MTDAIRYRKDHDGVRRKVVLNEDHEGYIGRWTTSCSGCFEFNEGYGLDGYGFDAKHQCYIGGGCHECGYTGKRRYSMWMPFDIAAWMRHVDAEEERQAAG
jgi:hypothetical protein